MKVLSLVAACAVIVLSNSLFAADTANQSFSVIVPTSLTITAPSDASITHDETDDPQAFPAQSWSVNANAINGVTVTFATAQPFVHTVDNTMKRDVSLALSLGTTQGPGAWSVTTASDQTDYANSDDVASVVAASDGAGIAALDLTVTFVTQQYGVFAAGTYTTTVTGTVVAN